MVSHILSSLRHLLQATGNSLNKEIVSLVVQLSKCDRGFFITLIAL
jgi:hypothetical protein